MGGRVPGLIALLAQIVPGAGQWPSLGIRPPGKRQADPGGQPPDVALTLKTQGSLTSIGGVRHRPCAT